MNVKKQSKKMSACIIPLVLSIVLTLICISENISVNNYTYPQNYDEFFSAIHGKQMPIAAVSLTPKSQYGYTISDSVYIKNAAAASFDPAALPVAISKKQDGPQVLIIHSHATESYSSEGAQNYDTLDNNHCTDNEQNMIAVGNEFARVLTDAGVEAIHDTTQFDNPSYSKAYKNSGASVKDYLEKYPSIRVVVDLHRDAIVDSEMIKYRPVLGIGDKNAAQVMFVIGASSDSWQNNLGFVVMWQKQIENSTPGICRPINLRSGKYNQQLSTGSVLIEIGSSGNYLSEAIESARICAKSLVVLLNNQ